MTDRGLPIVDGAPACPFVALEDDRDVRAASPDHRHRCYAEVRPAPRALAHQEAYCLSSQFPVCPTFQDWARREAARTRAAGPAAASPDEPPQRNPPRDWSAPPPWSGAGAAGGATAGGAAAASGASSAYGDFEADTDDDAEAPDFLAGRSRTGGGLAGSAADRLAGGDDADERAPRVSSAEGRDRDDGPVADPAAPPPFFARRDTNATPGAAPAGRAHNHDDHDDHDHDHDHDDHDHDDPDHDHDRRAAGGPFGRDRRPRVGDTRRRTPADPHGPSWERPRRYEAYPTLKTRIGLPQVPRAGVMAAALALAAIALFFLPQLLGIGSDDGDDGIGGRPSGSPQASVQPSVSLEPTVPPQPTPQLYTVAAGDTMSRIANRFGVPLEQLIEANRETIPDPDALQIGDQVIIPAILPDEIGATPAPSAAGSAAP